MRTQRDELRAIGVDYLSYRDGEIPAESVRILLEAGAWLKANGEAIYGAQSTELMGVGAPNAASLRRLQAQERSAAKTGAGQVKEIKLEMEYEWLATGKDGKIYIHLFKWPAGEFSISDFSAEVSQAYLLSARDEQLKFAQTGTQLKVDLPEVSTSEIATVLCLELKSF